MRRIVYILMITVGISALMGTGTSCKKEMFDEDKYDTLVKLQSPVDSVDPSHTWSLTKTAYINATINAGVGTQQLQILDENPFSSDDANVIAKTDINEGERVGLSISYPSRLSTLYAACVDSTGAYTVTGFNPSDREFDFSSPLVLQQKPSYSPRPQYYAFCYEQEFPEPGDYDYNDVVMHIALEQASPKLMYIHVRLAAVGANQQLAGCIRLPEFGFEDIDTVWTLNDESFNKDITDQYMMVLKEHDLLLQGLGGEAIINLFADAHWATGDVLNADYGMFKRKQYNVTKSSSSDAQLMVPREIVFALRLKAENRLAAMTLDNIDPFIIRQYNGANMEIHTYNYRHVTALNKYDYIELDHLPWALTVPYGSLYHPLHGINIGFRMRTQSGSSILFGAFAKTGHAFGEWAMDKNKAIDWYLYPDETNVFVW